MKMPNRFLLAALGASVLAGALSACAPLILGGAAVGAIVTIDRRTTGAQLDDEAIELRGAARLREAMSGAHINITSFNRQVLLTGEVPSEQARQTAEQAVLRVDNVKGIVNELAVLPNTTLVQRSSDTFITGKVKASIVDDRDLSIIAFKVVTERGVVFLMGRVTQREADRATQIARTISGVQRVVRIFEFITEDELRRLVVPLGGRPAAPAPAATPAPAPVPVTPPPVAPAPDAGVTTSPAAPSSVAPTALPPLAPASPTR
jgi:osmotically-inducible protein OsmY